MRRKLCLFAALGLVLAIVAPGAASAQTSQSFFVTSPTTLNAPHPAGVARCTGPVKLKVDTGFEGLKTTACNYFAPCGGGEGGRFDPVPVLSTTVNLVAGTCLNAHLSALVGSRQTYGAAFAPLTLFQVTLTPVGGAPQHMYGHYETPYGIFAPAVAIEAERDVDEFAANFFQRVGTAPGDVPPGVYQVNVWWAGAPGAGGALAAAFVLSLYFA